ncbi:hypothetical protein OROHE_014921 [Orobanche hederae]
MDRNWINAPRLSKEYKNGVTEFCKYATQHAKDIRFILCPCQKCLNVVEVNGQTELYEHLICHGIDRTYTFWKYHGEDKVEHSSSNWNSNYQFVDTDTNVMADIEGSNSGDGKDIPNVINEELHDHHDMHENLKHDAALPLWPGCTKASKLSAVLTLYNLKAGHQVSDVFFTELLTAISELLPDGNVLPRRTYEAKQMLKSIGLIHDRIHACPNDCILYRKEYAELDECPKCGTKRYKDGNYPAKIMWYFPLLPRLRRLYASAKDAKHLTWHHDGRIKDGMLRHPADSPQWKTFDNTYQDFGKEPRNIRLALSTDGMNPYKLQNNSHSTWPETFNGVEEEHRKKIISRAGNLHRQFRTRLRTLARDENGNYSTSPPPLYAHFSTVTPCWKEFVQKSSEVEFLEKSSKNKERAKAMEARYRKACVGYARLREIIINEKIKKGEQNPVVTRLDAWEYARRNAEGVVDDPVAIQILEDVVAISDQLPEHELTNIGTDDLLARLIPLEYSGRLRAVGWGVTKTTLQIISSVSELSQLKNDISFLKNEIKELKSKGCKTQGVQFGGSSHMDNFDIDNFDMDNHVEEGYDGHIDVSLGEALPQGKNPCYLYLDPGRRYVGQGILHNDLNDGILHGVPIEEGYVRVKFEVAEKSELKSKLPRPCDEANLVGEAPGYFLAWPRKLVSMKLETRPKTMNKEKSKHSMGHENLKDPEKERTLESIAGVSSKQLGYPLPEDVSHDGVLEVVRLVVMFDRVTDIQVDMGPFWNADPWIEHINKENVLEVLDT